MEATARLGVGLSVDVVGPASAAARSGSSTNGAGGRSRLTDVLDPAWLDDAECAAELRTVAALRAQLDAYEIGVIARLAQLRPDFWELTDAPGRPAEGWSPARQFVGVSEFLVDEVALVLGISRTRAHTLTDTALVLTQQLPATWHALADGRIDLPRARALTRVLGWQQPEVPAEVIEAVEEEALAWAVSGEGPHRLQDRTAALLLEHDAAAADRARQQAAREADVHLEPRRDGLTDLVVRLQPDVAAACRDAADRYARMEKADGATEPIGQLRTQVIADLLLRPWDTTRPAVTAHITVHAPLPSLTPPRATPDPQATPTGDALRATWAGAVERHGTISGQSITAAHLRELLARWTRAGLDELHTPAGGLIHVAITDPATGRLRAVLTETELRRRAAHGCPDHPAPTSAASPAVTTPLGTGAPPGCGCAVVGAPPTTDSYRPTAAQRRFIAARDRGCRHPGCSRPAVWTDADHVLSHHHGGETTCTNLCTLCRRHHRLKTHAPGWRYAMTPDGILHVTTPSGVTRTTRPPGMGHGLDPHLLHPVDPGRTVDGARAGAASMSAAGRPPPDPRSDDPPPF